MNSGRGALFQLVMARWRSFYREPGALFWSFGFPLLLSLALGTAFRSKPAEAVDVDIEAGEGADKILEQLSSSKEFRAKITDETKAHTELRTGKVSLVVCPGPPVTYKFDPTRPESRIGRLLVDDRIQRQEGRGDAVAIKEETLTEPGSRYIDFLIPGLIGTGLMQSGFWGIGHVIAEMRTKKLLKRLLATPMKKRDFLLAFVLMRALFLLVELPVLIGFATLVFNVPLVGSWVLLAFVCILGSLAFAGMGLLIASRAQNVQTATGLINAASLPMFITSGTFFSSARFPQVIQPVIRALPLTAFNDATRAVMLEGASILTIWREVAIMAGWGVGCFVVALWIFRWR